MSFISELKRRNVIRVALLYLVASWLMIQMADVGISILGLPVWTGRLAFLLLAIGFPLALVFSWAYEITPEGLKKEKEVDRSGSITGQTAKKLDTAVIVLLLLSLGGLIADRLIPEDSPQADDFPLAEMQTAPAPERSIAVLPFINMSADDENEYFSDGLSEELLNLLARIPELQVAARTSAFTFKGSNAAIDEIAKKLNVAHVLEGSVRKSGNNIRITAQLINASDGYHLWSRSWDRTLTDIFVIQDEIAAAVVDALKVTLLGEMPTVQVTDPVAYSLYLRSKVFADRSTKESFEQAVNLLLQALAIDPEFALAWSELATVQTNQAGNKTVSAGEGFSRARATAQRALTLDPENARAMATLGWNAMYWDWDFDEAARLISDARRLEPGNASVLNAYAVLNGNFGRRDSAISLYQEALTLDPLSMSVLANLAGAYYNADRVDAVAVQLDAMRGVDPESAWVLLYDAWLEMLRGNSAMALAKFTAQEDSNGVWGSAFAHYDLGQDAESDAALEELMRLGEHAVQIAVVYAYRGEPDKAFEWLERGYDNHDDWLIELRLFSGLRSLYGDPRWDALLEKMGLTDADAQRLGL
jgi:TolB-like protein/Flp pilus assembly protein TadD